MLEQPQHPDVFDVRGWSGLLQASLRGHVAIVGFWVLVYHTLLLFVGPVA